MNDKVKIALAGVLVVILFVLANSLYVVSQTEQAIVLQFGEPMRVVKEPGLKIKVPFIQNVVFYDNRLLNLDPPAQEIVLNDKKTSGRRQFYSLPHCRASSFLQNRSNRSPSAQQAGRNRKLFGS